MNEDDIREIGIQGLKGLGFGEGDLVARRQDSLPTLEEEQSRLGYNRFRSMQNMGQDIFYNTNQELGSSRYDDGLYNLEDINDVENMRALKQSGLDKVANGAAKLVTTAGTTFIDGTLGTLVGIAQGAINLADKDMEGNARQRFVRGLWDNDITNAMADVLDYIEKNVFSNYRSEWERDYASLWQKLGTGNFWGDSVLKNMGFMAGTAATMYLTGGVGTLGLAFKAIKTGTNLALKIAGLGKLAKWAGVTALSAHGESAIEAVDSARSQAQALDVNVNYRLQQLMNDLRDEYIDDINNLSQGNAVIKNINGENVNISDPYTLQAYYESRKANIDNEVSDYKKLMADEIAALSNVVYGLNLAALMVTNNLNMNSLLRSGYNNGRTLMDNVRMLSKEAAVSTPRDFAKAVVLGTAKFADKEMTKLTPKTIAKGLLNMAEEGGQEGIQKMISTTREINTLAKLNQQASKTILGDELNPGVGEELVDISKSIVEAWNREFKDPEGTGWEEVLVGALSAGIGMPSVRRTFNPQTQRVDSKFRWNTAFNEAYDELTAGRKDTERLIDLLNKTITGSLSIQNNWKRAVSALKNQEEMEAALQDGKIQEYKNKQIDELVSLSLFYREIGKPEMFTMILDELQNSVDENDAEAIKLFTIVDGTEKSPFDGMQNDKIKLIYRDYAKSTRSKIDKINEIIDSVEREFNKKLEGKLYAGIDLQKPAIREIVRTRSLLWDSRRRLEDINEQIKLLNPENEEDRSKIAELMIGAKSIERLIDKLIEKDKKYSDDVQYVIGDLMHDINMQTKAALAKDAEKAIEMYKGAQTLRDALDVYQASNTETRDRVLSQAIEQADDKTADLLKQIQKTNNDLLYVRDLILQSPGMEYLTEKDRDYWTEEEEDYVDTLYSIAQNAVDEVLDMNVDLIGNSQIKKSIDEKADIINNALNDLKDLIYERTGEDPEESPLVQSLEQLMDDIKFISDNFELIDKLRNAGAPKYNKQKKQTLLVASDPGKSPDGVTKTDYGYLGAKHTTKEKPSWSNSELSVIDDWDAFEKEYTAEEKDDNSVKNHKSTVLQKAKETNDKVNAVLSKQNVSENEVNDLISQLGSGSLITRSNYDKLNQIAKPIEKPKVQEQGEGRFDFFSSFKGKDIKTPSNTAISIDDSILSNLLIDVISDLYPQVNDKDSAIDALNKINAKIDELYKDKDIKLTENAVTYLDLIKNKIQQNTGQQQTAPVKQKEEIKQLDSNSSLLKSAEQLQPQLGGNEQKPVSEEKVEESKQEEIPEEYKQEAIPNEVLDISESEALEFNPEEPIEDTPADNNRNSSIDVLNKGYEANIPIVSNTDKNDRNYNPIVYGNGRNKWFHDNFPDTNRIDDLLLKSIANLDIYYARLYSEQFKDGLVVLLVVPYDKYKRLLNSIDINQNSPNIKSFNGKQYVIIGKLGYFPLDDADSGSSFSSGISKINNIIDNRIGNNDFFVLDKEDDPKNRLKDYRKGLLFRNKNELYSIRDLLSNKNNNESNPFRQKADDLKFMIVQNNGTIVVAKRKPMNAIFRQPSGLSNGRVRKTYVGLVYAMLPVGGYEYVPTKIAPVVISDIFNGKRFEEMDDSITNLIKAIGYSDVDQFKKDILDIVGNEKSKQEKQEIIGRLLSSFNVPSGYDVAFRDDGAVIGLNGQSLPLIINNENELLDYIYKMNYQFSFSPSNLKGDNLNYLLDADLLKIDSPVYGAVGSELFVYRVDANTGKTLGLGKFIPPKNDKTNETYGPSSFWYGNRNIKFDNGLVSQEDRENLSEDEIKILEYVFLAKQDSYQKIEKDDALYLVGKKYVVRRIKDNIEILSEEEALTVRDKISKQNPKPIVVTEDRVDEIKRIVPSLDQTQQNDELVQEEDEVQNPGMNGSEKNLDNYVFSNKNSFANILKNTVEGKKKMMKMQKSAIYKEKELSFQIIDKINEKFKNTGKQLKREVTALMQFISDNYTRLHIVNNDPLELTKENLEEILTCKI